MSPASNAQKFTFDTDFAGGEVRMAATARARQKKTLTAEELDVLAAQARHEGENSAHARVADALEQLVNALKSAVDDSDAEIEALRGEACTLALAMARKIAPAALAALPAGDVEIALRAAMHQAIGEPRITLRAAPAVAAVLEPQLAAIAQAEGYEGRVMIAEDPAMTAADCRIEWRGGGAERSAQAIEDALSTLIANRFSHIDSKLKG